MSRIKDNVSKPLKPVNYTFDTQKITFEFLKAHLWSAADILRGSLDSSECRQPVMTLLFLKRLNDTFEENTENIFTFQPYNDQVLSAAIRVKDFTNRWNYTKFCTYLSEIDRNFLTNPCYTERLILVLLGLDLTVNDCGKVNFKNLFDNFMNGINIMSNLYSDQANQ